MKKKKIQILSLFLALFLCCNLLIPFSAKAETVSSWPECLESFFEEGYDLDLTGRTDALYMDYAKLLREDFGACCSVKLLDWIYKTGTEPDREVYMKALVNIMKTYEEENASSMTQQNQLDEIKQPMEYFVDVANISLSVLNIEKDITDEVLSEKVKIAISSLSTTASDSFEWKKGVASIKTVLQNYEKYDLFLKFIEKNAKGELKSAAKTLRGEIEEVVIARFETYLDLGLSSGKNYALMFIDTVFSEEWLDWLQSYKNQNWLVKAGSAILKNWSSLKLVEESAKLFANYIIKAEDVIACILEIEAISDISVILENELISIKKDLSKENEKKKEETAAAKYIAYANYLISARIRGQYCMTSIYTQNTVVGLVNELFGKDTAANSKEIYDRLISRLLEVKKELEKSASYNDLSNFYLALQQGQYAISNGYKYYTIQGEHEGGEGMDASGHLYKENLETGEKTLLKSNVLAQCINVVEDKVFYTMYGAGPYNNGIHMISTDGSGYKRLSDCQPSTLVADQNYIYYAEYGVVNENPKIKRISYQEDTLSEETVTENGGMYIRHLSLLPGKLIYSYQEFLMDSNCEIAIYNLETKENLIVGEQTSESDKSYSALNYDEMMWAHGDYIYLLTWKNFYAPLTKDKFEKHLGRYFTRYQISTGSWEICSDVPLASYISLPYMDDYYMGRIDTNIEFIEKGLPSDFKKSEYVFSGE